MEVSLAGSNGLPDGCIISIKAGTTRRQVQKDGTKPLRLWFPKPTSGSPMKVDVLSPYGSAILDVDPAVETYSLDVNTAAGGSPVQLQLQVRDCATEHGDRGKALGEDDKTETGIASMQSYLDRHGVLNWTQDLIKDLLRDRPEELWPYVQRHMDRAQQAQQKQAFMKAPPNDEATASRPTAGQSDLRRPKEQQSSEHVTLGMVGETFMEHAHGPAKPAAQDVPVAVDLRLALEKALIADAEVYEADQAARTTAKEALDESLGIRAQQLGEVALSDGLLSDAEIQAENAKLKEVAAQALSRAFAVERGSLHDLGVANLPLQSERRKTPKMESETPGDLGLEQLRLRIKDTLSFAMKDHTLEDALKEMFDESRQATPQAATRPQQASPLAPIPFHKLPSVGTWHQSFPVGMSEFAEDLTATWDDTPARIPPGDALNYATEGTDGFRVTDAFKRTGKPTNGAAWMPHPLSHPSLGCGGALVTTPVMTWRMRSPNAGRAFDAIAEVDEKTAGKYALEAALSGQEKEEANEVKRMARQGAEAVLTETTNDVRKAMHQALGIVEEPAQEAKEIGKQALDSYFTAAAVSEAPQPAQAALEERQLQPVKQVLPVEQVEPVEQPSDKGSCNLDAQDMADVVQALHAAVMEDIELAVADRDARDVARFALEMIFDLVPPATPGTRATAAAAMESALCDDPAATAALAISRQVAATALEELPDEPLDDEEVRQTAKLALLAALDDADLDNKRYEVGELALQAMEILRTAPGPEEEAKVAGRASLEAMFTEPEMTSPSEGLRNLAREALEAAFASSLAGDQPAKTNIPGYGPYTFSAEPAVPRKPSRAGKALAAGLANSPSIAELEARIRERNARFRRENEALRQDNIRLKQMQESGATALVLNLENARLRKQLGNLVGQKEELSRSNVRRAPAVA